VSDGWIEGELKTALDEVYRPAPWLLPTSIAAVRRSRPGRPAWAWAAGIAAVVITLGSIAVFESGRHAQTVDQPHNAPIDTSVLPKPIPQPITRTSPAAQVAWLWLQSQGQQPYLIAVNPSGRVVARLDQATGIYETWRSADGATIYAPGANQIAAYSALDGQVLRTYDRNAGTIVGDTFSSDGHWLALLLLNNETGSLLGPALHMQVIDLQAGSSQVLPVPHDANASLPGMTCSPGPSCASTQAWGLAVFSPDATRLYTLTDWGGPARLSAFSLATGKLIQTATVVDGQQGRNFATCGAPAMAAKVIDSGRTLVAFCHMDGAVWFFDLTNLTSTLVIHSKQRNPFWLSPIFTPDGQLLYLHQWPGFGDTMQVIDLNTRKLLGPMATPTNPNQGGPFAWLITNAYAGGVASTVPISPDGLKLYSATNDGVMVLRIPDLKPLAKLAPGFKASEVWISGDGQTIYAVSEDGTKLLVMRSDGSNQRSVSLPDQGGGFIASEHG
jgi:WD40 repeat protein